MLALEGTFQSTSLVLTAHSMNLLLQKESFAFFLHRGPVFNVKQNCLPTQCYDEAMHLQQGISSCLGVGGWEPVPDCTWQAA